MRISLVRRSRQSSLLDLASDERRPGIGHADSVIVLIAVLSVRAIFRAIDVGIWDTAVFNILARAVVVVARDTGRVWTMCARVRQSLQGDRSWSVEVQFRTW